MDTVQST